MARNSGMNQPRAATTGGVVGSAQLSRHTALRRERSLSAVAAVHPLSRRVVFVVAVQYVPYQVITTVDSRMAMRTRPWRVIGGGARRAT